MKTLVSSQHVLSTRACLKTQCLQTSTSGSSCFKYFVIHFHWQPALCVDINVKLLIKELQAGMDRTIIITYQLLMACLRHLGTPMSTAGTQHWNKHVPTQTHSCRRHKHIKQAPDTQSCINIGVPIQRSRFHFATFTHWSATQTAKTSQSSEAVRLDSYSREDVNCTGSL